MFMKFNQWIATVNYPVSITLDMIVDYGIDKETFLSMDRDKQKEILLDVAEYYFEVSSIHPVIGEITSLLNDY